MRFLTALLAYFAGVTAITIIAFWLAGGGAFGQTNPLHPSGPNHHYPAACCGMNDCNPVPDEAIRETTSGYVIVATGEFIPYDDPRILTTPHEWPTGGYHWCRHISGGQDGKTICLYRPDRGV